MCCIKVKNKNSNNSIRQILGYATSSNEHVSCVFCIFTLNMNNALFYMISTVWNDSEIPSLRLVWTLRRVLFTVFLLCTSDVSLACLTAILYIRTLYGCLNASTFNLYWETLYLPIYWDPYLVIGPNWVFLWEELPALLRRQIHCSHMPSQLIIFI